MLRKAGIVLLAAALGALSALGAAGCGEKRGTLKIERGTGTETSGTGTAETGGTSTTPTATGP